MPYLYLSLSGAKTEKISPETYLTLFKELLHMPEYYRQVAGIGI